MDKIENDNIVYYIKNDILYSEFKNSIVMDLGLMKEVIKLRHEISQEKKQYWCYNTKGIKSYPKEARDYSEIHGQDYLHAAALVISSHIATFIFNAFSKINKPKIPFRAFRTEEEAVAWLKKIKADNEAKGIFL